MAAKTICIANLKGGVGKTTSTMSIGYSFSHRGYKVCLIDLDPQSNLTISMGLDCTDVSTYELIVGTLGFQDVVKNIGENISLLPSHLALIRADVELSTRFEREHILRKKLIPFQEEFDFFLIDCAPNLGSVTINGIMASDFIFTPMEAEFLSLQGLAILDESFENIGVQIHGIFINKYDHRKILNKQVLKRLEENYASKMLNTKIRNNISLAESQLQGVDIFSYDPKSHGALDYQELTDEILKIIAKE